jgi:hypothetical protein
MENKVISTWTLHSVLEKAAITAGLECAPLGVITTPGTKNPKYVPDLTARHQRQRNE